MWASANSFFLWCQGTYLKQANDSDQRGFNPQTVVLFRVGVRVDVVVCIDAVD